MNEELIQPVLWAATAVAALTIVTRALWARRKERKVSWKKGLLACGVVALLLVPAIGVVPPGHRGVVYEWNGGVATGERGEGLTLLLPWAQNLRTVDVRTQKVFSDKVFSQSLDLQEITVVASVNYHVDPAQAAELYKTVGPNYATTVIQPALFQRTKAAVGKVLAEAFARNRGSLAITVQRQLASQLERYGILVEFVNIEDAIFDKAFITAVKNKVIADQKAAEEQRLIAAEEAIKQQTIIQAEASAKSVRIKADADAYANEVLTKSLSPEVLRWTYLNAWNGSLPTTLLSDETKALLGIYP